MSPSVKAGTLYFALIFALGFLLGTFRVLILEPRLDEFTAVLLELPVILTSAWFICAWLTGKFHVKAAVPARLVMGSIAFVLLIAAEIFLAVGIFDRPFDQYLQRLASKAGGLGLTGQIFFALFPLFQSKLGKQETL
ncbi:MAG: hypothetical protein HKM98_05925 [Gammaproteobacteria bacterium]|nr:hypothetical protein [Gammaproteobacteria bacterium]